MNERSRQILPLLAALALGTGAPLGAGAQSAPADMVGTWTAPPGGTISRAIITKLGSAYMIRLSAPCSPAPCDWGSKPLTIYAPAANVKVGKLGMAVFPQARVTRTVIVTLQDTTAPFLSVKVFSKFAPSDGRSNSATMQTLH